MALPHDEELFDELVAIRWRATSNGKIQIEPKEELKEPARPVTGPGRRGRAGVLQVDAAQGPVNRGGALGVMLKAEGAALPD